MRKQGWLKKAFQEAEDCVKSLPNWMKPNWKPKMDPRNPEQIDKDEKFANEFSKPGTLKHFLLKQGFYPNNEEDAEVILINIIQEWEQYKTELNL